MLFLFLPLETSRPRWRRPYVTYGLMLLNLIVFLTHPTLSRISPQLANWGFNPANPSVLTWFTALFVHAGAIHLIGNMLFLWVFGTIAEDVLGPWLFLAFYFGGALGATVLDILISMSYSPDFLIFPRVGASGAIAGIMGLAAVCFAYTTVRVWYLVGYIVYWRTGTTTIGAPAFIGLWAAWEVVQGLVLTYWQASFGGVPGVAHWAHVGGFLVGLVGALALGLRKKVGRADLIAGRSPVTHSLEAFSQLGELERLVKESPNDAEAQYALGRAREISGRTTEARAAYETAMIFFLRQRRMKDALRAYRAIKAYNALSACPDDVQFDLACVLEEAGQHKDAFELFRQIAHMHKGEARAETALFRAGELAGNALGDRAGAVECYQALLCDYPFGQWKNLCAERLRQLGVK